MTCRRVKCATGKELCWAHRRERTLLRLPAEPLLEAVAPYLQQLESGSSEKRALERAKARGEITDKAADKILCRLGIYWEEVYPAA